MGLHVSHGCWSGSYRMFKLWRTQVALAAGIELNLMQGYGGKISWSALKTDAVHVVLHHSDSDGEIAVADCLPLADRLEELIPSIDENCRRNGIPEDVSRWTCAFADGLRIAVFKGEIVRFS